MPPTPSVSGRNQENPCQASGDHRALPAGRGKVSQPLGILSILICLLIASVRGGNPVAIKVVLQAFSPLVGAAIRVTIACASIALFSCWRKDDLRPRRNEIRPLMLLGMVFAVQISALQTGSDFTSPLFVAVLFNTYPIIANLTSSFVVPEDRLTPRRVLGLAAAFAGMAWVFLARTQSDLAPNPVLGNALVLGAATVLALRMVYVRQLVLRVDYVRAVFWPSFVSVPLFLLGDLALPDPIMRSGASWETWVALGFQGVVIGGAGQLAWVYLIRRHTPGTVIAFSFLTPISGLLLSASYFNEPVPARLITGLAAVLTGIGLAARRAGQTRQADTAGAARNSGETP